MKKLLIILLVLFPLITNACASLSNIEIFTYLFNNILFYLIIFTSLILLFIDFKSWKKIKEILIFKFVLFLLSVIVLYFTYYVSSELYSNYKEKRDLLDDNKFVVSLAQNDCKTDKCRKELDLIAENITNQNMKISKIDKTEATPWKHDLFSCKKVIHNIEEINEKNYLLCYSENITLLTWCN